MPCITSNNQQLGIMTNITVSDDEYDHDNGEQDDDYYTSSTTTITMDHANREHVFSKVEDTSSSVTTCACTLDNNSEHCGSVTACSLDGSGTSHSMGSSSGAMRNRSNNRNHGRAGGANVAAAATAASEAKAAALTLQIESLRQQLAERDATVNELQRQIQQDRRNHEKLLQRWNLFFGSTTTSSSSSVTTTTSTTTTTMRNRNTTVSPSTSSPRGYGTSPTSTSSSTTVMTSAELQRIHDHMDQLEREKDMALQKAVQLSVALAESRAKVSTLESQLEESNNILQMVHHNQSNPFLLGFAKRKTPVAAATTSAVVGTPKMQQHHETSLVESSDPPITDIQLDDDDSQHDDPNTDERMTMMLTLDDPLRFVEEDMSLESESISSWSQRRCGHLSEHSDYSTSRRPIKATTRARRTAADDTMTNQSERGNSGSSNAYRLTSSLRGFLGSSLRNVTSSSTTTPAHT